MSERLAILGGAPAAPPGIQQVWPRIPTEDKAVLDRGISGGAKASAPQAELAHYVIAAVRKIYNALNTLVATEKV